MGLNDKADAFRHAYWMALNAKEVGIFLAVLYGAAHEDEVPQQFAKEKEMDLHNNLRGSALNVSGLSDSQIADNVYTLIFGTNLFRYLSPILFPYNDPCFWGCLINPLGTHGILPTTLLIPTNQ